MEKVAAPHKERINRAYQWTILCSKREEALRVFYKYGVDLVWCDTALKEHGDNRAFQIAQGVRRIVDILAVIPVRPASVVIADNGVMGKHEPFRPSAPNQFNDGIKIKGQMMCVEIHLVNSDIASSAHYIFSVVEWVTLAEMANQNMVEVDAEFLENVLLKESLTSIFWTAVREDR